MAVFKILHTHEVSRNTKFNVAATTTTTTTTTITTTTTFFFFFYWRYNPLWVLGFSVILFHSSLTTTTTTTAIIAPSYHHSYCVVNLPPYNNDVYAT